MVNSRDISKLRPDVRDNCKIFLEACKGAGLPVLVTGTVRDKEYQEWCFHQGTAKTKTPSFHAQEAGLAFDICKNIKGHEYDDLAFFETCAGIAKNIGFEWGGEWKNFPDRPHFQWSGKRKEYTSQDILAGRLPPFMPLHREKKDMTPQEAKEMVQTKMGLSSETMAYLNSYIFADELFCKLARAMK